jgi:hypothetical protein
MVGGVKGCVILDQFCSITARNREIIVLVFLINSPHSLHLDDNATLTDHLLSTPRQDATETQSKRT